MELSRIPDAIDDIRRGRMVILIDDEDRENEGDLVIAAEKCTAASVDFMATEARGLICLALATEWVDKLQLVPVTMQNQAPLQTAFLNSIDARGLGRPGISAQDRAHTIQSAISEQSTARDFVTPGYVFPLRARRGGVLVRSGQTEGSVDLARLAGLKAAAVICEVMNPDGTMARLPELLAFGAQHNVRVVTVADLIEYRLQKETFVQVASRAALPTAYGQFEILAFQSELDSATHVVLRYGDIDPHEPVLIRVHRSELLPDVFGAAGQLGKNKLDAAMRQIVEAGAGLLLYLRGEALDDELLAHSPRPGRASPKFGPPQMDFRDFGIGAQILSSLGVQKLKVLTNHPMPFRGLKGFGLEIVEWVPLR
jgi:3,4-dihydroxy 2-butanone 4-phosphate synthase/GTP cyclohydrolase II